MIASFRHKGLKEFYESESKRGIPTDLAARISRRLDVLQAALELSDVDAHGFSLHRLKGARKGEIVDIGERQLANYFQVREGRRSRC
jgi:toxin HigB-1